MEPQPGHGWSVGNRWKWEWNSGTSVSMEVVGW